MLFIKLHVFSIYDLLLFEIRFAKQSVCFQDIFMCQRLGVKAVEHIPWEILHEGTNPFDLKGFNLAAIFLKCKSG